MIHNFDLIPLADASYEGVTIASAEIAFPHGEARGEAVQLINGENYVHNMGYYHHDRVPTITGRVTVAQAKKLVSFLEGEVTLYFSDELATYSCYVQTLDVTNGALNMTLKILDILIAFDDIVYPPAPVPPSPTEEWLDVTSDTYWDGWSSRGRDFLWDGSQWYIELVNGTLNESLFFNPVGTEDNGWNMPTGSWAENFRPSKFRITYAFTATANVVTNIGVYLDTSPDWNSITRLVDGDGPWITEQEYDIDYDNPYQPGTHEGIIAIKLFEFYVPTSLQLRSWSISVTKIEFYGIKTW